MNQSSALKGNVVVGQSGGPTVVINQSLVGVVEALRGQPNIGKVLGCLHGVRGIVDHQYIQMQDIPQDRLDRIAQTPSSALGSSRDKPDEEYCQRIFESFAKEDVRYFFYIGGNDSSDTCRIVNELARKQNYELRCFHVPKTIDNDLMHNDHTPGYGSAARFVACAFMGDNLDNRALPGVKINVIMGRHAGFLTAAAMLARQNPEDGPHLIYVPEVAFKSDKFLADVDRNMKKHGRCLIAVSEGIADDKHEPIASRLAIEQGHHVEKDSHGNVQLSGSGALGDFLAIHIKNNLGKKLRVRADTFGYLQRSFAGCVSATDAHEARKAGRKAADLALGGDLDGSIAIQRVNNDPYRVEYQRIELSDVAGKTRTLDRRYIVDDNNIADSFAEYLNPIVGKLPVIEFLRSATH
ncbi:MAG: diphosphate--fructose-6-phosphate 1-phosphotransferase [Phycisphaera sp.]|nr:diphosphate--fructose-6-phosphate 1-phosphotransferase [Phycisphaera sp.]